MSAPSEPPEERAVLSNCTNVKPHSPRGVEGFYSVVGEFRNGASVRRKEQR